MQGNFFKLPQIFIIRKSPPLMGVLGSANLSVTPNPSQAELFLPFNC
jgi:hypothetical protein